MEITPPTQIEFFCYTASVYAAGH